MSKSSYYDWKITTKKGFTQFLYIILPIIIQGLLAELPADTKALILVGNITLEVALKMLLNYLKNKHKGRKKKKK